MKNDSTQNYYLAEVNDAGSEGVIVEFLGRAAAGSVEGERIVENNRSDDYEVIVDGFGAESEHLANGTRVRIDSEGVIVGTIALAEGEDE